MSEHEKRAGASRARGRRAYWLFSILGLAGLALVVLIATLVFGRQLGQEFSPHLFARRDFYYYQIPLLGIQVTPVYRSDATNSLETYLQTRGSIPGTTLENPRWDLVTVIAGISKPVRGDAEILCRYLEALDQRGDLYWRQWSIRHPAAARVLWPLVAFAARQQLYVFVPDLFELADREVDPGRLAAGLRRSLAVQYERLADIQDQLENGFMASELRDHAALMRRVGTGRPAAVDAPSHATR